MIRTTISRIKRVCAIAFVPRVLRGDVRYIPGKFEKLSYNIHKTAQKSTKSTDDDDMPREDPIQYDVTSVCEDSMRRTLENMQYNESQLNVPGDTTVLTEKNNAECTRIIAEIFGEEVNPNDVDNAPEKIIADYADIKIPDELENRALASHCFRTILNHEAVFTDDNNPSKGAGSKVMSSENVEVCKMYTNYSQYSDSMHYCMEPSDTAFRDVEDRHFGDPSPEEPDFDLSENPSLNVYGMPIKDNTTLKFQQSEALKNQTDIFLNHEGTVGEKAIDFGPHLNVDADTLKLYNVLKSREISYEETEAGRPPVVRTIKPLETIMYETYDPKAPTVVETTTAKIEEEKLAQKVEHIDETDIVEAQRPKVEGFNLTPKVLGDVEFCETVTLDEAAKNSPEQRRKQMDDLLLREMEKLGVPLTGHKTAGNATLSDQIHSPINRPRKPASKKELELEICETEKVQTTGTSEVDKLPKSAESREAEKMFLHDLARTAAKEAKPSQNVEMKTNEQTINFGPTNYANFSSKEPQGTKPPTYSSTQINQPSQPSNIQQYLSNFNPNFSNANPNQTGGTACTIYMDRPKHIAQEIWEKDQLDPKHVLTCNETCPISPKRDTDQNLEGTEAIFESQFLNHQGAVEKPAKPKPDKRKPLIEEEDGYDPPVMAGNASAKTNPQLETIGGQTPAKTTPKFEQNPSVLNTDPKSSSPNPFITNSHLTVGVCAEQKPESSSPTPAQQPLDCGYTNWNSTQYGKKDNPMLISSEELFKSIQDTNRRMAVASEKLQATSEQLLATSEKLKSTSEMIERENTTFLFMRKDVNDDLKEASESLQATSQQFHWTSEQLMNTTRNLMAATDNLPKHLPENYQQYYIKPNDQPTYPSIGYANQWPYPGLEKSQPEANTWDSNTHPGNTVMSPVMKGADSKDSKDQSVAASEIKPKAKDGETSSEATESEAGEEKELERKDAPLEKADEKQQSVVTGSKIEHSLAQPGAMLSPAPMTKEEPKEITGDFPSQLTPLPKLNEQVKLSELLKLVRERNRLMECTHMMSKPAPFGKAKAAESSQVVSNAAPADAAKSAESTAETAKSPAEASTETTPESSETAKPEESTTKPPDSPINLTAGTTAALPVETSAAIPSQSPLESTQTQPAESKRPSGPPMSIPFHNVPPNFKGPDYPKLKPYPKICVPKKKPKSTKCTACDLETLGIDDSRSIATGGCHSEVALTAGKPTADLTEDVILQLQTLGSMLGSAYEQGKIEALETLMLAKTKTRLTMFKAKDYEPWSPIPSWPHTKKHERPKLQCPKEGCPTPPPRCLEDPPFCPLKPCETFPTFPKRSFSVLDYFTVSLGDHKVIDLGEF
ncbi:uncharacterized protein LOC142985190 [Anticarsia gemmatalis]|uniref:uncharacterized protein LOC142985190 n=1 Tax=Anticarsia gemmatalis TaxID=129554 RepID=UPI003F774768